MKMKCAERLHSLRVSDTGENDRIQTNFSLMNPTGIEREMRIMYQQPHLVPPMKLTVFDAMPATPTPPAPSQLSKLVSQGKASLRSSLSIRRPRPSISEPQPPFPASQDLPFRRPTQKYRPLELSIYMPNNRLSDLPEFDRLSFTDVGEIKLPARALVRTKSEEFISHKISTFPTPAKPASMIEQRRLSRLRPDVSSTVISVSRPPSEYDALHSHPVSWASLPGLPPTAYMTGRSEPSVAILTPMQEEFSPLPTTSITVDGVVLDFPQVGKGTSTSPAHSSRMSEEASAPAPHVPAGIAARNFSKLSTPREETGPPAYFHPNYQTQKRISQWLSHRGHSSSVSTVATTKTSSTTTSFAEHRQKRSQFYQLSSAPPKPLSLWPRQHQRTMTESTVASTVDTDILSFDVQSRTDSSITTAPELQSRSGTIKSISHGLRPILSGVPDVPPCYADVISHIDDDMVIKEIGGPLRSPGVGVAF